MTTYTTISGDTWDMISYKVYKLEYYINELMTANPKYIEIAIFNSGIKLTIPEITREPTVKLPLWKRT
jgi:phage tail protein X